MPRMLLLALVALLSLAGPSAAQTFTTPELGFQNSGTCPQLAARDRSSKAMVPLGCLDAASKSWMLTPGKIRALEGQTTSPSASYGGVIYQNTTVAAGDVLGPQQPPSYFTVDGIRSTLSVKPDTTAQTSSGFGFYVQNKSTRDATGLFGTTTCEVDGCSSWGLNPTVIDSNVNGVVHNYGTRTLVGAEFDFSVTSPNTIVSGVNVTGSSIAQPAGADAFQVGDLAAANPGVFKWSHGLTIGDATSQIGLQIGANALTGASIGGMENRFNFRDQAGAVRALRLQASGTGAFNFGRVDGANGVAIQPALAGAFPRIVAYGSDANPGLVLQAQGSGQIVAQSLLNANQGLYVNTSTTLAGPVTVTQPVKYPVYTVANLPTCNAAAAGSVAVVNDAANPAYGAALTGGGSATVLALCGGNPPWAAH